MQTNTSVVMLNFEADKGLKAGDVTRQLNDRLAPIYGSGESKAMIRLIFHALKGWNATDLIINEDREITPYILKKIDDILARLEKHEPLQYILGEARFYGMDLKVSPSVLIPRHETEELVDLIVKENTAEDLKVLDIGTGSGAIAIALSRNLKFSEVTAIDISPEAVKMAQENALALHARIKFDVRDVFAYQPSADSFDIIVSNPPYVAESEKKTMESNVLDYEPAGALFVSDSDPLIYYSRIAEISFNALRRGGKLYFEINPKFSSELRTMLEMQGFKEIDIIKDISHKDRFAKAVRPS